MATTFTLTPGAAAVVALVPLSVAIALDSAAGTSVSIALSDGGAGGTFATSPVVITTGNTVGAFTYTPPFGTKQPITITATASGGLVLVVTLLMPVNFALTGLSSATQIITQAMGIIEVKAAGQALEPEILADMFDLLNNSVLDGWRTETLYASGVMSVTGILKAGVKTMTIGPTGDLATPNVPIQIEDGAYFTSGNGNYPIDVDMTDAEFRGIFYPTLSTLGPDRLQYSSGTPNGIISFYPQSGGDVPVTIPVLTMISSFTDLATQYQFAPGVRRALAYALAMEAQGYFGKQLNPAAANQGALAIRNLQRSNHQTPAFQDSRLQNKNILSGFKD